MCDARRRYHVGGNTKFCGAALFRLRKEDLGEIKHHGGISPAWPIGYEDLEPYYTQAERLYHVHGHECHQGLFSRNLYVGQRIPLAGVAHQVGTIRFGNDRRTSVLDVNCKAHDVDNLYVVGVSFFVSSGAVNPALTIMANALRVGDDLLQRLK